MKYGFPEGWFLNIKDIGTLSKRLNVNLKYLKDLENKIPKNYRVVSLTKKGKNRLLSVPSDQLKNFQKAILKNILIFDFPVYVQGGISGRSIVKNANFHKQKNWVACLDIHKFFPSVHYSKVRDVFINLGCSNDIATVLTHFTTYNYELPQGAPTSPVIANLILYNFDVRVSNLCKTKRLQYSRYFDDVTISGNKKLDSTCSKVVKIAKDEGFNIPTDNPKKFNKMYKSSPQIVTGLIVNGKKLKPNDDFISDLIKNIEILSQGHYPSLDIYKLMERTKGMISFLESIDFKKASVLKEKMRSINWNKFGLNPKFY